MNVCPADVRVNADGAVNELSNNNKKRGGTGQSAFVCARSQRVARVAGLLVMALQTPTTETEKGGKVLSKSPVG